jgi:ubiquinone/menaquinone biosynthesis C-methylase UbiE
MSARHGNRQKYENINPVQRLLISRFLSQVSRLVSELHCTTLLDAGCAEGYVSHHIQQTVESGCSVTGVDIDESALRRGVELVPSMGRLVGNVAALPFRTGEFDLVLCTEVLEHLADPAPVLAELHRVTSKYCLLSVPHEPWFRLLNLGRGRHLRRLGNDPEHVQNWTGRQFCRFVSPYFEILTTRNPMPWSVVMARKR